MRSAVFFMVVSGFALSGDAYAAIMADDAVLLVSSPTPTVAVEAVTTGETPVARDQTCVYKLRRNSKSKNGCRVCPQRGDRFDSGIPCAGPCPEKFRLKRIPCPDENQGGICHHVKGKKPRCER